MPEGESLTSWELVRAYAKDEFVQKICLSLGFFTASVVVVHFYPSTWEMP
eukprot:m.121484 g.121484  ORF g.121484 m.121484 type:complete len:50 (+) comp16204_c1_seq3:42-191(+)